MSTYKNAPSWLDRAKLSRAQEVYRENIILINIGLSVALIESYAFPIDANVLVIAGGLTTSLKGAIRRLSGTGKWIHDICTRDMLEDGGKAHKDIMGVRFIHALVRKKCLQSPKYTHADTDHPINQGALGGTLFLFCQTTLEYVQERSGVLPDYDLESYWHLWRYVGVLSGVKEEYLPESYFGGLALQWSDSYLSRQIPDKTSIKLCRNTLEAYSNFPGLPFNPIDFETSLTIFWSKTPALRLASQLEVKASLRGLCEYYIFCTFWKISYTTRAYIPFLKLISTSMLHTFFSIYYHNFGKNRGRKCKT
eukprot:TRINITY_DN1186_c0_g2_i1.p1 TRINITY_DN1186_c0_g2~~TRINITY_DN1186_c0_g2_i1.p1  ORF type:complete len:326 (-),score=20.21 TRINITY_DN1186_c0_g2_i1:68-991(-)